MTISLIPNCCLQCNSVSEHGLRSTIGGCPILASNVIIICSGNCGFCLTCSASKQLHSPFAAYVTSRSVTNIYLSWHSPIWYQVVLTLRLSAVQSDGVLVLHALKHWRIRQLLKRADLPTNILPDIHLISSEQVKGCKSRTLFDLQSCHSIEQNIRILRN